MAVELRSKREKKAFLQRLFELLEDGNKFHSIGWTADGNAFSIARDSFMEQDSPRYFQGIHYHSFTRRLKRYGFRRVTRKNSAHAQAFRQDGFQQGNFDVSSCVGSLCAGAGDTSSVASSERALSPPFASSVHEQQEHQQQQRPSNTKTPTEQTRKRATLEETKDNHLLEDASSAVGSPGFSLRQACIRPIEPSNSETNNKSKNKSTTTTTTTAAATATASLPSSNTNNHKDASAATTSSTALPCQPQDPSFQASTMGAAAGVVRPSPRRALAGNTSTTENTFATTHNTISTGNSTIITTNLPHNAAPAPSWQRLAAASANLGGNTSLPPFATDNERHQHLLSVLQAQETLLSSQRRQQELQMMHELQRRQQEILQASRLSLLHYPSASTNRLMGNNNSNNRPSPPLWQLQQLAAQLDQAAANRTMMTTTNMPNAMMGPTAAASPLAGDAAADRARLVHLLAAQQQANLL